VGEGVWLLSGLHAQNVHQLRFDSVVILVRGSL